MWKRWISIWFALLVAISGTLIGIGRTEMGTKVQLQVSSILAPVQKYASFLFNTFKIRHENKVLRQKIAQLAFEKQQFEIYKYENEKLKSLLEFKAQKTFKLIPARVIARGPDPISGICMIDKGQEDGVEENLPVITPEGVYGKVLKSATNTATVQTIFNFNFRVSAMDAQTGDQGIVKWESGKGCVMEKVPIYSEVKIGDKVVTSGLGSVFPKGLEVGIMKEINVDKTKLFYSILLEPACKFSKVEYVFCVKEAPTRREAKKEYEMPDLKIYQKKPPLEFKPKEPYIRREIQKAK